MLYDADVETLPRERLRSLQADQLRSLIGYVKGRVALYGKRLVDVEPDDIASLDDLRHLPFTRKADLRDTYPFGMFAVERDEVIRIHASSGTTGKLTVVGYTAADVDLFARVNARCLRSRAEHALRETIGCSFSVALQPPGSVRRSEGGKLQRVVDRRQGRA